MNHALLIEANDCALIIVDVQKTFTDKLPEIKRQPLINRICWIISVARWLDVPIVVTAEDVARLGGVAPDIQRRPPKDEKVYDKMVFGIAGNPDILGSIDRLGRHTLVLVGLESDVCVAQSALSLLERGYKVVVPEDAIAAPGAAHHAGVRRMSDAGVLMTLLKALFYEWVRTVNRAKQFHDEWSDTNGELPSNLGWEGYGLSQGM